MSYIMHLFVIQANTSEEAFCKVQAKLEMSLKLADDNHWEIVGALSNKGDKSHTRDPELTTDTIATTNKTVYYWINNNPYKKYAENTMKLIKERPATISSTDYWYLKEFSLHEMEAVDWKGKDIDVFSTSFFSEDYTHNGVTNLVPEKDTNSIDFVNDPTKWVVFVSMHT